LPTRPMKAMRHEVKAWLDEHLVGDVALLGAEQE
jgi:hypothetical protein